MATDLKRQPHPFGTLKSDDTPIDGIARTTVATTEPQATFPTSSNAISDHGTHSTLPPYRPNPFTDNPTIRDAVVEPKVKRTVQYREIRNNTIVYTRSFDDNEKSRRAHAGTVFEVFDVNMTEESSDTKGTVQHPTANSIDRPAPTVSYMSRQYIRIYSHAVLNALQAVINYYPGHAIVGDHVELYEPYAILVHHWDDLKDYRDKFSPDVLAQDESAKECALTDTYEHLGYLLNFLEEIWGDKVRREQQRWAQPVPMATYEMLWLLLRPGTDVYFDLHAKSTPLATKPSKSSSGMGERYEMVSSLTCTPKNNKTI